MGHGQKAEQTKERKNEWYVHDLVKDYVHFFQLCKFGLVCFALLAPT
jgi:hypothetical protein